MFINAQEIQLRYQKLAPMAKNITLFIWYNLINDFSRVVFYIAKVVKHYPSQIVKKTIKKKKHFSVLQIHI